jgi:hypothetical protein
MIRLLVPCSRRCRLRLPDAAMNIGALGSRLVGRGFSDSTAASARGAPRDVCRSPAACHGTVATHAASSHPTVLLQLRRWLSSEAYARRTSRRSSLDRILAPRAGTSRFRRNVRLWRARTSPKRHKKPQRAARQGMEGVLLSASRRPSPTLVCFGMQFCTGRGPRRIAAAAAGSRSRATGARMTCCHGNFRWCKRGAIVCTNGGRAERRGRRVCRGRGARLARCDDAAGVGEPSAPRPSPASAPRCRRPTLQRGQSAPQPPRRPARRRRARGLPRPARWGRLRRAGPQLGALPPMVWFVPSLDVPVR